MKWRPIIFGIIIIICIVSINYAIYWMLKEEAVTPSTVEETVEATYLLNQFKNIFDNTMDDQGYIVGTSMAKKDIEKEMVYTRNTSKGKNRWKV